MGIILVLEQIKFYKIYNKNIDFYNMTKCFWLFIYPCGNILR